MLHPIAITDYTQLPALEELPGLLEELAANTLYKNNKQDEKLCQIRAGNDAEAVYCWLKEYQRSPQTYKCYQKEAERLLLWCVVARQKALSQLDRDDFDTYFQFLAHPAPKALWCSSKGGRGRSRCGHSWKPFTGPLNLRSREFAVAAIHSLMKYLVAARYLIFNPFALMRKTKLRSLEERKMETLTRILEPELWEALKQTILAMPEATPHERDEKARTRFTFAAFFYLGLRASELAKATWGQLRQIHNRWWFITHGKGNKLRKIPVSQFLDDIIAFRTYLKLPPLPETEETLPLIPSWRHGENLSARHLQNIVKRIAIDTATQFTHEPQKQKKLLQFSPHWLRHQSSSAQAWAGIDKAHVKENLGHASLQTTEIYFHTLDEERHNAMQKHVLW